MEKEKLINPQRFKRRFKKRLREDKCSEVFLKRFFMDYDRQFGSLIQRLPVREEEQLLFTCVSVAHLSRKQALEFCAKANRNG